MKSWYLCALFGLLIAVISAEANRDRTKFSHVQRNPAEEAETENIIDGADAAEEEGGEDAAEDGGEDTAEQGGDNATVDGGMEVDAVEDEGEDEEEEGGEEEEEVEEEEGEEEEEEEEEEAGEEGEENGAVRLTGGNSTYEGKVNVFRGGSWNTLCDRTWTREWKRGKKNAAVVCRQLGFGMPLAWSVDGRDGFDSLNIKQWNTEELPIISDRVYCSGTEARLNLCPVWGVHPTCHHLDDVYVRCQPPSEDVSPTEAEDANPAEDPDANPTEAGVISSKLAEVSSKITDRLARFRRSLASIIGWH